MPPPPGLDPGQLTVTDRWRICAGASRKTEFARGMIAPCYCNGAWHNSGVFQDRTVTTRERWYIAEEMSCPHDLVCLSGPKPSVALQRATVCLGEWILRPQHRSDASRRVAGAVEDTTPNESLRCTSMLGCTSVLAARAIVYRTVA